MSTTSVLTLTKKTLTQFLSFIVIAVLLIACQKGDTGPAGATGATGATGSTGATGATGTANVIYSAWFTPATYVKDTVFGIWGFNYNDAATAITQPILDSGTILTFGKLDGYVTSIWPTNQVAQLPIAITYMDGANPNIDTWSALATLGNLKIRLVSSLNAYGSISNAHQFRYILIPGGVKAGSSIGVSPATGKGTVITDGQQAAAVREVLTNYKQMSYSEICQRLNIPE